MIVSHRARCIFVHIQKTGGSSIEHLLRHNDPGIDSNEHLGRRHIFARDIEEIVGGAIWSTYFKFAFVRNPWDRMVSWYHMCIQTPTTNAFSQHVRDNAPTFNDFLTVTTTGLAKRTTFNQVDFLTDAAGTLLVDYVGRYESLDADVTHLKATLGLSSELPHVNQSAHEHYRSYYTDATREIVAARFRRDIVYFGYQF